MRIKNRCLDHLLSKYGWQCSSTIFIFFQVACCFRRTETFFMLMSKLLCLSYAFGLHAAFLHCQGCKHWLNWLGVVSARDAAWDLPFLRGSLLLDKPISSSVEGVIFRILPGFLLHTCVPLVLGNFAEVWNRTPGLEFCWAKRSASKSSGKSRLHPNWVGGERVDECHFPCLCVQVSLPWTSGHASSLY